MSRKKKPVVKSADLLTDQGFQNHFGFSKAEMSTEIKELFYFLSLKTDTQYRGTTDYENNLFFLKQLDDYFTAIAAG